MLQVPPSSKVRHLGVVFDLYLIFHDHISGICKYTYFHLRGIGIIWNLNNNIIIYNICIAPYNTIL